MEQVCPRCKTTKYLNPSLKLMVNVCGHSLCENCVSLLFARQSGVCPQCNTALRRNQFRLQQFEDSAIEKDVDIRKRILKDFNKQEDDFEDLRLYNDYLEMVETISGFCGVSSVVLVHNATYSQMPASQVLASHMAKMKNEQSAVPVKRPVTQFSSGTKLGGGFQSNFMPVPQTKDPLYVYEYHEVDYLGPVPPNPEELETEGFMEHVRSATPTSLAGGYTHRLACQRALQDAFSGLFFFPAKVTETMDVS
ncbi:CDK-activating kinase assembly factor MAT1-like [Anneissia japonica]|uniref:CDK-activating kinase assembly factor MAT1-like n=1 Tax=Anneissia japonica TaxID=1529436 RepID=UPI0014257117|nr:CDK-activating kinase assembly factor MAT1-like [Anneissia japonica]